MVTEHVLYFDLKGHFWVLNAFCLLDLLFIRPFCLASQASVFLLPFVVFGLSLVWLMSVLPMIVWPLFLRSSQLAFFSSRVPHIPVFISVRIGFEPCDNHYIQLLSCSFCIAGPSYLLLWQDVVFLITAICLLILSLPL